MSHVGCLPDTKLGFETVVIRLRKEHFILLYSTVFSILTLRM